MTDFSKYFTDPSAQVYGADETESALWQQSSTNPFAVLHAIAARRNANNRRDQYGEQLAAHDQRAVTGARTLMADENKYNSIQEMLKQRMISPGLTADLSSLRTPENSQQFNDLSDLFTGTARAAAFKDMGAGSQSFAAAGKDPMQEDTLSNLLGVGNLADVATTGERDQEARGRNDSRFPFKKTIIDPRVDANGNMITYTENYGTREEMLGAPPPVAEPGPPVTGPGKTNAGGATRSAPITAPSATPPVSSKAKAPGYAPQPKVIPPGPVKSDSLMSAPPQQQQALLTARKQGIATSRGAYVFEQNSLESDGNGNLFFRATLTTKDGKDTAIFGINPEGKAFLAQ